MMKITINILGYFILFFSYSVASAQQGWDMVYNFCTDSIINSTVYSCYADTDCFFVTGATSTYNVSPLHGTLAAFDYNKNLLWYKKMIFPGEYNSSVDSRAIIKLTSNKYLLLGEIYDYTINANVVVWYPYFYVFNSLGDSINYRKFEDSFRTINFSSAVSEGSTFTAVGRTTSKELVPAGHGYNYAKYYLHVSKYDTALNLIWDKQLLECATAPSDPNKIIMSSDGAHYLITGAMPDTSNCTEHTFFVKMDTSGNLIWAKVLPKKNFSWNYCDVVANPAGGYYFVSSQSLSDTAGSLSTSCIYYGKLNEDGDTLWTRNFSDSLHYARGYQIEWSHDKIHLLILGTGDADTRPALLKIDTLGNIVWYRRPLRVYNFTNQYDIPGQGLNGLSVTPDEKYLMVGGITGPTPGLFDTSGTISWMILTDSSGCRYPGDPGCWPASISHLNSITIRIYPNPVYDELYMEGMKERTRMLLYDVYGRQVYNGIARSAKETIPTNDLPPGNYILQLTDADGKRSSYKVLKQ